MVPPQIVEAGDVHELTGGAVWLGGVEEEFALEAENVRDGFG